MNATVDLSGVHLETDRLILREWKETDLDDLFEYASVDGVGQMAGWQPHKSLSDARFVLKMFIDGKKTFALELKENHNGCLSRTFGRINPYRSVLIFCRKQEATLF